MLITVTADLNKGTKGTRLYNSSFIGLHHHLSLFLSLNPTDNRIASYVS